jgi:hypothetical protein
MAGNSHHIELNGEKYWLAQDAEGVHHREHGEPLRPPNAVQVQGEAGVFQTRPDKLQWTLTDWSGGEGYQKFDPAVPNGWRELNGVRVFDRPGTVTPGYYVDATKDSGGSSDLAVSGSLVRAKESLYLLSSITNNAYLWDDTTKRWGSAISLTGVTGGVAGQVGGDQTGMFWVASGTDDLWFWDGSAAPSKREDLTGILTSGEAHTIVVGGKIFVYHPGQDLVWEVSKTVGLDEIFIDDFDDNSVGAYFSGSAMAAMDGKIYLMVTHEDRTEVREITPTGAAGTGFGAEVAKFIGFIGFAMWAHSGVLYLYGSEGTSTNASLLYFTPGGEYGSLGNVRRGDEVRQVGASQFNARMLTHYFAVEQLNNTDDDMAVFEINSVNGAFAAVAINEDDAAGTGQAITSFASFKGQLFWSTGFSATTKRVMRAFPTEYMKSSEVISAWHDFGLADEKVLSSLTLSTEPLPANWSVFVDYAINGVDTWTQVISLSGAAATGTKVAVSTSSSTVKVRTLSIRIRMQYTGGGIPTTAPVVLGVDATAMVIKLANTYNLLLSLNDSKGRVDAKAGSRKAANIRSAGAAGSVVSYVDLYSDRNARLTYNVIIDEYAIRMETPGEGVAEVVLKEAI